jgi:hypothetical protein
MADGEEIPLPEGMHRPGESEADQQRQLVSYIVLSDTVQALEEGKLTLALAVKSLKENLEQHKQDARDVYYYLNKKCDDSYEVIAQLEEQLLTEQADREVAEKRYEEQILHDQRVNNLEQDRLHATISKQSEKLTGLDDFLDQKEGMEEEMAVLKATLQKEREQNKTVLKELDLSWTIERDKLRKGYHRDLAALRQEMDDKLVGKMTEKTINIHTRNNQMSAELHHQSKQADQVLIYNQMTVDRDRQLRVDLELAAAAEQEMSKKLGMYQRVLKELNAKMTAAEDAQKQLSDSYAALEKSNNNLREDNAKLIDNSRNSLQYRAGKVVHFALATLKGMVGDDEFRGIIEGHLLKDIQSEQNIGKKHEATLVKLIRLLINKYPDQFPVNDGAGTAAPISFFPSVSSPKPGGGSFASINSSGGKGTSPRRHHPKSIFTQVETVATQTDEHRDPLQSDSMWITGAKPKAPSPINDDIDRLFQGGHSHWGGGSVDDTGSVGSTDAQTILNNLSVKSSSAIPIKPPKGIYAHASRRKYGGSLDEIAMSGKPIAMNGMIKANQRKVLTIAGKPSKLSARPDRTENKNGSPQSSVSMSPRLHDDDTIATISPRYENESLDASLGEEEVY